jgi:hypothetical protein
MRHISAADRGAALLAVVVAEQLVVLGSLLRSWRNFREGDILTADLLLSLLLGTRDIIALHEFLTFPCSPAVCAFFGGGESTASCLGFLELSAEPSDTCR